MSLRVRLTLFVAGAAAVAVAAVASAAYVSADRELVGEIDAFLRQRAVLLGGTSALDLGEVDTAALDQPMGRGRVVEPDSVVQFLSGEGEVLFATGPLPVDDDDRGVASGRQEPALRSVDINGEDYRVLTASLDVSTPLGRLRGAVQVARSLEETNSVLSGLKLRMLTVGGLGVALAALAGWFIAGRALRPVGKLTAAAEHVALTQDLEAPIHVEDRNDEVGRLATSFNAMLSALAESRRQQRQLIADAGHELRTPLTSLRTNIELLARARNLPDEQRQDLIDDATAELEELSDLVGELVDLATDNAAIEPITDVRLDEVVGHVVNRARRRWNHDIRATVSPIVVEGRPTLLDRAITNLVDNAAKWSPPHQPIEVTLEGGTVSVRDHGPGIADEDLARVFDRFYRATTARSMPGSGLGLAIVKQVAEDHGGTAFARSADGGGAVVGFSLPNSIAVGEELRAAGD